MVSHQDLFLKQRQKTTQKFVTLETRRNLGQVASRSCLWDHYWGCVVKLAAILSPVTAPLDDTSPVTAPHRLRDATRPRLLLVFKVANGRVSVHWIIPWCLPGVPHPVPSGLSCDLACGVRMIVLFLICSCSLDETKNINIDSQVSILT